MMLIRFLIGTFIPVAHAYTIGAGASGGPGVSGMQAAICGALPFCGLGTGAVPFFTQKIVDFVFPLVGGAAVIIIVYAGIRIIASQGKDDGLSEAKKIIIHALAGVVLAMLAGVIITFFGTVFLPTLLD